MELSDLAKLDISDVTQLDISQFTVAKMMQDYGMDMIMWVTRNISNLIFAILLLLVGNFLCRKFAGLIKKTMLSHCIDPLLANFVRNCIFYVLHVALLIAVAGQLGINTTSFLALLGSMGLAVGLAIKDNLANFSSGVMLILFRPFTLNDFVTVGGVSGTVKNITLSNTVLCTPDNQRIIVPNNKIMGDIIVNTTGNKTRRIDLVIGVGYGDNLADAKRVIEDVLKNDAGVLKDPAFTVAVAELNASSVDFIVRPWVETESYWTVRYRLLENIKNALDANGISIPYPQQDVHIISEKVE